MEETLNSLGKANEIQENRIPKPLFSEVLIKNPLTAALADEVENTIKKLPASQKEAYLKENFKDMWKEIIVIATGSECRFIKPGDSVIPGPGMLEAATQTPDGKYLFIPERVFKGVW